MEQKKRWIDWRIVGIVLLVIFVLIPLLIRFIDTVLIQPDNAHSATVPKVVREIRQHNVEVTQRWANKIIPGKVKTKLVSTKIPKGFAHKSTLDGCRTGKYQVSVQGSVLGIGVGPLYTGYIWQRFCWRLGVIRVIDPTGYKGVINWLGETTGWSYQGLGGYQGPYIMGNEGCSNVPSSTCCFGCLHTVRVLKFHQCTPLPIGCWPGPTKYLGLGMRLRPNNSWTWYWQA